MTGLDLPFEDEEEAIEFHVILKDVGETTFWLLPDGTWAKANGPHQPRQFTEAEALEYLQAEERGDA